MYAIKCRCGAQTKNFKHNIGAFYMDRCCEDAGYNSEGVMTKSEPGPKLEDVQQNTPRAEDEVPTKSEDSVEAQAEALAAAAKAIQEQAEADKIKAEKKAKKEADKAAKKAAKEAAKAVKTEEQK